MRSKRGGKLIAGRNGIIVLGGLMTGVGFYRITRRPYSNVADVWGPGDTWLGMARPMSRLELEFLLRRFGLTGSLVEPLIRGELYALEREGRIMLFSRDGRHVATLERRLDSPQLASKALGQREGSRAYPQPDALGSALPASELSNVLDRVETWRELAARRHRVLKRLEEALNP